MEPSVTPCAEPDPPETTVCLMACSPHADGTSDAAARVLERALASRGVVVDHIRLRDWKVHPCIGCGHCVAHSGACIFDGDGAQELFRRIGRSDVLLLTVPVYFYGPPALLKGFIDRAQALWAVRPQAGTAAVRDARVALFAARTRGERLFEANLLILRCFLDTLGFGLRDPLLLRGVEGPSDIFHPQTIAQLERLGLEAAEQAIRFHHE